MCNFIHLHNHSYYSTLDGLNSPKAMVNKAIQLGHDALAITDHGTLAGAIDFHRSATKEGVKPILGCEFYMQTDGETEEMRSQTNHHLLCIAYNQTGWQNLIKLSTWAETENFYYRPRITFEKLAEWNEGLITTTGCMASIIHYYLLGKNAFARS